MCIRAHTETHQVVWFNRRRQISTELEYCSVYGIQRCNDRPFFGLSLLLCCMSKKLAVWCNRRPSRQMPFFFSGKIICVVCHGIVFFMIKRLRFIWSVFVYFSIACVCCISPPKPVAVSYEYVICSNRQLWKHWKLKQDICCIYSQTWMNKKKKFKIHLFVTQFSLSAHLFSVEFFVISNPWH